MLKRQSDVEEISDEKRGTGGENLLTLGKVPKKYRNDAGGYAVLSPIDLLVDRACTWHKACPFGACSILYALC